MDSFPEYKSFLWVVHMKVYIVPYSYWKQYTVG